MLSASDLPVQKDFYRSLFRTEQAVSHKCSVVSFDGYCHAIDECLYFFIKNIELNEQLLSLVKIQFVYDLFLANLRLPTRDSFINQAAPGDWETFVKEFVEDDQSNIDCGGEVWVLSQIYSGNHCEHYCFTFGWLVMNAVRMKHGHQLVFPAKSVQAKLRKFLRLAGPPSYDAESLRGLTKEFVRVSPQKNVGSTLGLLGASIRGRMARLRRR